MYKVVLVGKDGRYNMKDPPVLRIDDSIGMVKKKILLKHEGRFAHEELYLHTESAPLGQLPHEQLPVNPFDVTSFDGVDGDIVGTRYNTLLMETTYFDNKTIFVCFADEVLNYISEQNLSEEMAIRHYFPALKVNSLKELEAERKSLRKSFEDEKEGLESSIEMEKLFYEHGERGEGNSGILDIQFVIHTDKISKPPLPLDSVFKLIHATEACPLTKYNPGRRFENVYRLHVNGVTANRKKIPSLPKGSIFRFDNTIGKGQSVSVLSHSEHGDNVCIFLPNGSVEVNLEFNAVISIDEVDEIVRTSVQPIIEIVSEYLQRSNISYLRFNTLREKHIEILNMTYEMEMNDVQIGKCAQSIFNIIDEEKRIMRFKRVSGYNDLTIETAHITELVNRGVSPEEIKTSLQINFGISEEEATNRVIKFINEEKVLRNTLNPKRFKSRENPGFLIEIRQNKARVIDVDHIGYLDTIPIYLDALSKIPDEKCNVLPEMKPMEDVVPLEEDSLEEQAKAEPAQLLDYVEKKRVVEIDFFANNDEDEEESSDEEEESTSMSGGAKTKKQKEDDNDRALTHVKVKKPDPFKERNNERVPEIFQDSKYDFQSEQSKVPIAITNEELAYIEKHHPGSLYDNEEDRKNIFKYKTDVGKEHWYICPRYWSFSENSSVSQDWIEKNEKDIYDKKNNDDGWMPRDKGVYEFFWPNIHVSRDQYNTAYPAFKLADTGKQNKKGEKIKTFKKNSKGYPMIGCYKKDSLYSGKGNAIQYSNVMDELGVQRLGESAPPPDTVETFDQKVEEEEYMVQNDYIQVMDRFPLSPNRFGYLPPAIQRILQTDNQKCQVSKLNPTIKSDHPCLLRQGVEHSSLLAAVADVFGKTLDETREHILSVLDLDTFHRLHNGNLVQTFDTGEEGPPPDLAQYASSKLYRSVDQTNPAQLSALRKAVRAYKNYRASFESDAWELVSTPGVLIPSGLNLFVLELKDDDLSDKVYLACPTNHYADTFIEKERQSIFIVKREGHYEPIYAYRKKKQDDTEIYKTFNHSEVIRAIYPQFPNVFDRLKRIIENKCRPLPSEPEKYKFERNISLGQVVNELLESGHTIKQQVLNFQGKVIAVVVEEGFLVPCYPSAPVFDIEYIWMNSLKEKSYEATKDFLSELDKATKIACAPQLQVKEGEKVVGILTAANQFVPVISSTVVDVDLDQFEDANHYAVDEELPHKRDEERITNIENMYAEEKLFALFRNRVRALMREDKYRKPVESILSDDESGYDERLVALDAAMRKAVGNTRVIFVEDKNNVLLELAKTDRHACANDRKCQLIFPRENLINDGDNEQMYYSRIADELLRYHELSSYIMNTDTYLQLEEVNYDMREDEILLLQSMLTQEYFAGMVPVAINPNVNYGAYDTSTPQGGQNYSLEIDQQVEDDVICEDIIQPYQKTDFSDATNEWSFANSPASCSFNILLNLCKGHVETESDIKKTLIQIYKEEDEEHLEEVFKKQKKYYKTTKEIEHLVLSEEYHITVIDIVALANHFSVPLLLVRMSGVICLTRPDAETHFVIQVKGLQKNPKFSMLTKTNDDAKLVLPAKYAGGDEIDLKTYMKAFYINAINTDK